MTPSERLSEILNKLQEYWHTPSYDKDFMSPEQAKATIIELMREMVPDKADSSVPIVGLLAWDSCREKILTSIEGLK